MIANVHSHPHLLSCQREGKVDSKQDVTQPLWLMEERGGNAVLTIHP